MREAIEKLQSLYSEYSVPAAARSISRVWGDIRPLSAGNRHDIALELRELLKRTFNEAADAYYQLHTRKTFEELDRNGYRSYERNSWADGCRGDEWESILEASACGEEAATQALEREDEAEAVEA